MSVEENLQRIQERINNAANVAGRNPEDIHIVAVTKYVTIERAEEAVKAGIKHLGENRLEGAMEKYEAIGDQVSWHFIGSLQSRKVKDMIHAYDYIHSLDRTSLAKEINKRSEEGQTVKCFVQVNVSGEESKAGLAPAQTLEFIETLKKYPAVEVVGLMTMAPYEEKPEKVRDYFRNLKHLRDEVRLQGFPHAPCKELSMGMSNDFEIAVEEGATFIRVGSSLVGEE
ncbi:YggS family pyridoxal phosphate-dependent enzyme [Alkalicoccus halolimnae]|uniref:Pyridoxal phosphate homeostasis protein n=1 Tax=Alkalicoccus halolimnae TaxID=1667239 RepID=A0A5C7FRT6_9BACI|nr:YggS family pyridoxal phosphate-dependent enzyme [Alkalicoccus halolimnae]TXF87425.1 YggS family pyridoxal phosphate-dependent enzyme [Alkalicoccus halolimnae]